MGSVTLGFGLEADRLLCKLGVPPVVDVLTLGTLPASSLDPLKPKTPSEVSFFLKGSGGNWALSVS